MTIQGDKTVSHAQFKCRTVPRLRIQHDRSQDGGYWQRTHDWELFANYLLGEQDVRGKDRVLQVNLMKEVVARSLNNQYEFWIWIRSEKCLFCPRPIGLGPALVNDRNGK